MIETRSRVNIVIVIVAVAGILNSMALRAAPPAVDSAAVDSAAVDSAAVQALQRMTDYVSGLKQFRVRTQSTLEDQLDSGQRIDYDVAASVTVRRPNAIRAERTGEGVSQVFYYDGQSLTLYDPPADVYATVPAPNTIEELLDYTRESLGLVIPVSDLVYRNAFAILMQGVTSATVVGQAMIGQAQCTHLAFSRPDIDFQVWVAEGERPLPCKYVVTDTSSPAQISTVTVMSDWDLTPVTEGIFEFTPPSGAQAIAFLPPDKTSAFGR